MRKNKKVAEKDLFFFRVPDFLNVYLTEQCGRSKHTVTSYRDALSIFRRFITDELKISIDCFLYTDCSRDLVLSYSQYLQKRYTPKTCNQRLAALKAYIHYSVDEDIGLFQLATMISRIPQVKEPKIIRPILSEEMMSAVLRAPNKGKNWLRDKLVLIILYDCALREEELCNLKIENIHLESNNSYLIIRGKGDKERLVPISKNSEGFLNQYLGKFHPQISRSSKNYLFYTTHRGQAGRMSEDNVQRIVKKYTDMVRPEFPDMPDRVYPHMFRRTRATHLYQENVPLEMVGRILGHSSIDTTKIYATPSVEMLRDSMENSFDIVDDEPLWEDEQNVLAKFYGLR